MNTKDIGERILFLRKNKGVTQEQLAKALNITNQAVSKWESGQCLPDIQLIPEIATFFDVSISELFGEEISAKENDLIMQIKNTIDEVSEPDKYEEILKIAKALHAIVFVEESKKEDSGYPKSEPEETIEHAINNEWGISVISVPKIRATMRGGCVFFSGSQKLHMEDDCSKLSKFLKAVSNRWTLSVLFTIYEHTSADETSYASIDRISEDTEIEAEAIEKIVKEDLGKYLDIREAGIRIKEEFMNIPPILSTLIPIM
ncbi:Transcriptional regulator, contains XRE-family HTH domain [Lachnospiraceae bacterium YSD2013]|nr:Transcriptional regulator, contains XRE-family HTH domain [Lachnospiraceae bacterium YSD2013]